jgi:hypothetical protein
VKANDELRPGTRNPGTLASTLINSSVIPSLDTRRFYPHPLALLGDEQLGVISDVDRQEVPDLEFHVGETLGWIHSGLLPFG